MCESKVSLSFAGAGMMSPTGKSHTFDVRADGYARSEACCSCAMLSDEYEIQSGVAYEGSAVRSDGKSATLTAPNGVAQKELISAVIQTVQHHSAEPFGLDRAPSVGAREPTHVFRVVCGVAQTAVSQCAHNVHMLIPDGEVNRIENQSVHEFLHFC